MRVGARHPRLRRRRRLEFGRISRPLSGSAIRSASHISHVEARTPAEQIEALRTYAAQGYDLVFAHGFEFQDAAERVSAAVSQDGLHRHLGPNGPDGNVSPLIFRLEEASYLAGMVAGG